MKIILHEGKDDKKYIKRICEYLKIETKDDNFYEMNNKSNFFKESNEIYQIIKSNPRTSKILFILDADYETDNKKYGGYANTERAIVNVINNLGLQDISRYYITCTPDTKDGFFETLLLSCVSDKLKKCYIEFMKCSGLNNQKEQYKTIMTKLHELASPNKPYDFNHPNFKELKEKLEKLFE